MKISFDHIAAVATNVLASGPMIVGFTIWLVAHNAMSWNYTNFISDVAIEIGLLILRAENAPK